MSERVGRWGRWSRFIGEGLVIFIGAALALFADDWRESRAEEEEVSRSLAVIYADLAKDSVEMESTAGSMMTAASGARWLLSRWEDDHADPDSVRLEANKFGSTAYPEFRTAGFDGMQNANLLRLIEDPDLREWIREYYDAVQPAFRSYFYDVVLRRRERVQAEFERHQVLYPLVAVDWDAGQMRSPWTIISSDLELEGALVGFYGTSLSLGNRMTASLERITAGRRLIRDELGSVPNG